MNLETPDSRANEMITVAERLLVLAQNAKQNRGLLSVSIALSVMSIEAYTNALIWLKIKEEKDPVLLEKYTDDKKGSRSIKQCSIRIKVREWTKKLAGDGIRDKNLMDKFNQLIDLRNQIVHYQIKDYDGDQFIPLAPYNHVEGATKIHDPKKRNISINEMFYTDYLRTEITVHTAKESIITARQVMAALNKCYYGFIPSWLI